MANRERSRIALIASVVLALLACHVAHARPRVLDDFESGLAWETQASEGVNLRVRLVAGEHGGSAMRIEYDFTLGSGFGVARLPLGLDVPENFRLSYRIRGNGPANDFECKLLDAEEDDVWWVNRRRWVPPAGWTTLADKRRAFGFAWGPEGGAPLERLGAIEFAVASSSGGSGWIEIDDLQFEALDPDRPYAGTPRYRARSDGAAYELAMDAGGRLGWEPRDHGSVLEIDYGQRREIAALLLEFEGRGSFRVVSDPHLDTPRTIACSNSIAGPGVVPVWMPGSDVERVSIEMESSEPGLVVRRVRTLAWDEAETLNALVEHVASWSPRGDLPTMFAGRQCFWTVVGGLDDANEALIDEHGSVEPRKGGARLEPFLIDEGRWLSWADGAHQVGLADGFLPIPTVQRTHEDLTLAVTAVADEDAEGTRLLVRYRVENHADHAREVELVLVQRPYQILPPWQQLNMSGGVVPRAEVVDGSGASVELGVAWSEPSWRAAGAMSEGEFVGRLRMGDRPGGHEASRLSEGFTLHSRARGFALALGPGESRDVIVAAALDDTVPPERLHAPSEDPGVTFERARAASASAWKERLGGVRFTLPDGERELADAYHATLAYILVNQDGHAIHPGSRTYERSWIRDGSVTGHAMLAAGLDERVDAYLLWYAGHQFESGKVPCVVDRRGPDPVDEHDSTGQLIYLVRAVAEIGGRTEALERYWDHVEAGVGYLEGLIDERSDGEWAGTAYEGLVPESISHEGYSDHPMHSYWDCFWVLRGLRDAAWIAEQLGRDSQASRWRRTSEEFASSLRRSIRLAMQEHGIDFIPGCVELGDFDATSTAVALHPLGLRHDLDRRAMARTFEHCWEYFDDRRRDEMEWHDYTPYELRIVAAMVRLGERERAHEMLRWYMRERRPSGWQQWPEVNYRDDRYPGWVGDCPHTWVGAGFMNSLATMFAYGDGDRLILGAGLSEEWLLEGVGVRGLRTRHGPIAFGSERDGSDVVIRIEAGPRPAGGVEVWLPDAWRDAAVTLEQGRGSAEAGRVRIEGLPAVVRISP